MTRMLRGPILPTLLVLAILVPAVLLFTCGGPQVGPGDQPNEATANQGLPPTNAADRLVLDPPLPSPQARGELLLRPFRGALTDAGAEAITGLRELLNNPSAPPAGFSQADWAKESRPDECGYRCVGAPSMEVLAGKRRVAEVSGTVRLELTRTLLGPGDRERPPRLVRFPVEIDVRLQASCTGWQGGDGSLDLEVSVTRVAHEPDAQLDDLLVRLSNKQEVPAYFAARVKELLRTKLGMTAPPELTGFSRCTSLGVRSNQAAGKFNDDAFVWDLAVR